MLAAKRLPPIRRAVAYISLPSALCCSLLCHSHDVTLRSGGATQNEIPASQFMALAPDVVVARNHFVRMRDGIGLATDIYLPARDSQPLQHAFPVILVRTPYDKTTRTRTEGIYYARQGYAFVSQDVRGRFGSQGQWRLLSDDGRDGADTCNWIGRQPWSTGRIGMQGVSYDGGVQHALALHGCKYLKTVVPIDAMSNPGYAGMRYYGAFELRWLNWILTFGAPQGSHAARDPVILPLLEQARDSRMQILTNLPLRPGATPLRHAPEYERWLIAAMSHGGRDASWNYNNVVEQAGRYQDLPVCLIGGWYDSWAGATAANYTALAGRKSAPIKLIMGPWTHGGQMLSGHGQISFGAQAALPDRDAWVRIWFDRWLKGIKDDAGQAGWFASPVRIFVMGTGDGHKDGEGRLFHGGFWRDEQEWPLARARQTKFYLTGERKLTAERPAVTNPTCAITYTFDPHNPVPTIGGNISSGDGLMERGGWDQRGNTRIWNWPTPVPLRDRPDVLAFETESLEDDVEVTGPITVTVWASSSARDTDFTAKLIDEYPPSADWPDGFALNLGDGIVRARYRDSFPDAFKNGRADENFIVPHTPYRFVIRLYPTSNVFKRGHRIRLDISSSNFPRFDVNPNTAEPLGRNRQTRTAQNTIYCDSSRPSLVTLPIIPAGNGKHAR